MGESRRSEFVRRLSTVGMGTRESIHVLLGSIVYDIRERVVHRQIAEEDMDEVSAFHDAAEALWRDCVATDPPLDPEEMIRKLRALTDQCTGPLGDLFDKLDRGLRNVERFQQKRTSKS